MTAFMHIANVAGIQSCIGSSRPAASFLGYFNVVFVTGVNTSVLGSAMSSSWRFAKLRQCVRQHEGMHSGLKYLGFILRQSVTVSTSEASRTSLGFRPFSS